MIPRAYAGNFFPNSPLRIPTREAPSLAAPGGSLTGGETLGSGGQLPHERAQVHGTRDPEAPR